jgi:hypothetical protein
MKNINKELLSLFLIIASGTIILGIAVLMVYGVSQFVSLAHSGWYLTIYILTIVVSYVFHIRYKNTGARVIYKSLIFPAKIFKGFIKISTPYLILQTHLALYLFFAGILPLGFFLIDQLSDLINLNFPTHIYIMVTFSVVFATLGNAQLKKLIYLVSPFRLTQLQKHKKIDFKELTDYLLSESNIKFIIYSIYFLYLIIINLFNFQQNSFYSNPETDKAVLQSFITFIALERLVTNLKELDFKPSEMIKRLLDTMTDNEKDLKGKS